MFKYFILLLPSFVCLFFAILLFCNRKSNLRPQNIWIWCMIVMGICTFIWSMLLSGVENYSLYYKLDVIDFITSLQIFPCIYLYFRSLTNHEKFTWKQYLWFAPGLLAGLASIVLYIILGEEQSTIYIKSLIENHEEFHSVSDSLIWKIYYVVNMYAFGLILFIQIIFTMIYATINIIRYKRGLTNFFSSLDEKSLENNRAVLIGLFAFLIAFLFAFSGWFLFYKDYFVSIKYFTMFVLGVVIFYMSYHVYTLKFIPDIITLESEEETSEQNLNPVERNEIHKKILPQIIKLMDEDRIFLQPNLTLDDIARTINSNRTYISRVINEEFQANFYDFINRKRIDYAKTLIVRKPNLTQEQIANESGFKHASTFSRIFKNYTGSTFREWQKRAN